MADFDLSTAKPVEEFDLASAKPVEAPKRRSPLEMVGRQVGLTARAGIEGAAALPLAITDAPTRIKRAFGGQTGQTASEAFSGGLTKLGLPEPETGTERVVQDIAGGMAGTGGVARLANVGKYLPQVLGGGAASGAAGGAREAGAPPWAQSLVGLATLARPGMLGLKPPATSIRAPGNAMRLETFEEGRKLGLVVPPNEIEPSMGRAGLEIVGGRQPLQQKAQMQNQPVIDEIGRREASMRPNQRMDPQSFRDARYDLAAPYREVAKLDPSLNADLKRMQVAQDKARDLWNDYGRNLRTETKDAARAADRQADRLENNFEMAATRLGRPDLIDAIRDAKVKIAKNHDVQNAVNQGSGNVDGRYLGNKLDAAPERMSGDLRTLAKFSLAFKDAVKEGVVGVTPSAHLGAHVGSGGIPSLFGWLGSGIPFARGPARALSLSGPMQKPLTQQQGIPLSALTSYLSQRQEYGEE